MLLVFDHAIMACGVVSSCSGGAELMFVCSTGICGADGGASGAVGCWFRGGDGAHSVFGADDVDDVDGSDAADGVAT